MRAQQSWFGRVDLVVFLCYVALVCFGWVNIYAASNPSLDGFGWDWGNEAGRQLVFIGMGSILMLFVMLSDARIFEPLTLIIYLTCLLLLIAVLLFGKEVGGNKSWLILGPIGIQPSELAKLGTTMGLAAWLNRRGIDLRRWSDRWIPLAIFGLPMLLILAQPDTGSAIVFMSFLLVLYLEGLPGYLIYTGLGGGTIAVLALALPLPWVAVIIVAAAGVILLFRHLQRRFRGWQWIRHWATTAAVLGLVWAFSVQYLFDHVLRPHQQTRIQLILGQIDDPGATGYQTAQSLIAIGSGGWFGQGFNQGSQTKLSFVPEQSTDYIFTTVGEEWGFMGALGVLIVYSILIMRLYMLAMRQKSTYSRVVGHGVASIFLIHYLVNIGMTLGIVPVIGIPLPLFSYGGSSLWAFTLMLFIFMRLDAHRWQSLS